MSLSPRKKAVLNRVAKFPEPLPCPECGALAQKRVRGVCTLRDGTVIRNLSRYRCTKCGANLFDDEAMAEIRRQRSQKAKAS